jgi:hypothetical protein
MSQGNQTTFANTITLPELTDLVRRNWIKEQEFLPRRAREMYIYDFVGSGKGSSKIYNEIDTETFADYKPEGANSTKSKNGIGYNKTMTARTFSKEIDITIELRNDGRYLEIGSLITSLSQFCLNRQELDLTHRLTFAGSSSYVDKNGETIDLTVGDGNPLIYATHSLAFSSVTYANEVTGDPAFSQGAYEAAKLLSATQVYSNFGEQRVKRFNTIFSYEGDPSTCRAIRQMLESTADVDAVQSGIKNVYAGTMKHIELPYLATTAAGAYDSTKRRYWGIASTGLGLDGWQAFFGEWIKPDYRTPNAGSNGEDIHSYNWTYSTLGRWGICTPTGKGIVMSLVSN